MKKIEKTFSASRKSIDEISAQVKDFLSECKVTREISLLTCLSIEEALLSVLEEHGKDLEIELKLSKRLGKPLVALAYRGKRFNPIAESLDEVTEMVLNNLDSTPIWTYRSGVNRISYKVPVPDIRSEVFLMAAVALALLAGICGIFVPAGIKKVLIMYILSPVSTIFLNFLMALAPMLIFLSVVTSIARGGEGANFNKIGRFIITHFIGATTIIVVFLTLVLIPFLIYIM